MSTHKHIDRIALLIILTVLAGVLILFAGMGASGERTGMEKEYETGLFSTDQVHTIEITMDDWEGFLEDCENEEYVMCDVTIDGQTVREVGIRAKGNTSLTQVKNYGNDRYSFKLEFDHYQDGIQYQGLDKLNLNNIIQDNTYMKDYLSYRMMQEFGVDAPLCSYAYITVNGEEWGLYLAVEGVEESFLERNYGDGSGELYKPDSVMSMGDGEVGGDVELPEDFDFSHLTPPNGQKAGEDSQTDSAQTQAEQGISQGDIQGTDDWNQEEMPPAMPQGELPEGMEEFDPGQGGGMGGMSSDDVKLIYTDDAFSSYSNIFENAKTAVTDQDKTRLIRSLKTLNEGEDISSVVNVEEVMRYFVVHNFVCNYDSYTGMIVHNYYLYEEDGVLSIIPWDYNLAFGGFLGGSDATSVVNDPIDSPVSSGSTEDRPMVAWIFQEETYTQQYHALYDQFITTYFESGAFETEFDQVSAMIAPYVERDPTKFCTYDEFETGVSTLKAFCQLRAQSIRGQLDGTIPSTTDGQQADDSALVDASSLSISDMGEGMEGAQAIGGMGPMGGDQGREERQPPGRSDSTQEREASQSEGEKPTEQEEGGIEQGR